MSFALADRVACADCHGFRGDRFVDGRRARPASGITALFLDRKFVIGWACVAFFGFCGAIAVRRLFDAREQVPIGSAGIRFDALVRSDNPLAYSRSTRAGD